MTCVPVPLARCNNRARRHRAAIRVTALVATAGRHHDPNAGARPCRFHVAPVQTNVGGTATSGAQPNIAAKIAASSSRRPIACSFGSGFDGSSVASIQRLCRAGGQRLGGGQSGFDQPVANALVDLSRSASGIPARSAPCRGAAARTPRATRRETSHRAPVQGADRQASRDGTRGIPPRACGRCRARQHDAQRHHRMPSVRDPESRPARPQCGRAPRLCRPGRIPNRRSRESAPARAAPARATGPPSRRDRRTPARHNCRRATTPRPLWRSWPCKFHFGGGAHPSCDGSSLNCTEQLGVASSKTEGSNGSRERRGCRARSKLRGHKRLGVLRC